MSEQRGNPNQISASTDIPTISGQSPSVDSTIVLTPAFKFTLLVAVGVTLVLLAVMVAVGVFVSQPNDQLTDVMSAVKGAFQIGIGAIFGLLGGKATSK